MLRAEQFPPSDSPAQLVQEVRSSPKEIVLGHRNGESIFASRRGCLYSFTGEQGDVLTYLRDLALHAAVSHSGQVQVWTTPDLGLSKFPSLRVFNDPRGLVSELEIEILKRHRMFDEEGTQAWEGHQEVWPDDPLALVLGIAPMNDPSLRNRFQAVVTQGQDLGIIVLTVVDEGATLRVEDRHIRPLNPELRLGTDPFEAIHLTDTDRRELLEALAEDGREREPAGPRADEQRAPRADVERDASIRVRLLGPPEISAHGQDMSGRLRRKTRELLTFFLLHPEGAGREQVIEGLWPEMDADRAYERFWFQLSDLRNGLRDDSRPTAQFIDRVGDVYRIDPEAFDVDVWRFDELLEKAASEEMARPSLEAAAGLHSGELLQGVYYEWAEPLRVHFRDQLLDVLVQLAEFCEHDGDEEAALGALVRAISLDPYAEQIYRRLMRLYAKLGRAADIHRAYRELEAALSEGLNAEPSDETTTLKNKFIRELTQSTDA